MSVDRRSFIGGGLLGLLPILAKNPVPVEAEDAPPDEPVAIERPQKIVRPQEVPELYHNDLIYVNDGQGSRYGPFAIGEMEVEARQSHMFEVARPAAFSPAYPMEFTVTLKARAPLGQGTIQHTAEGKP